MAFLLPKSKGVHVALKKPKVIANDAYMSTKWDEVTSGREFSVSEVSSIVLLCQWYKIVSQAQSELAEHENKTVYTSENGDLKPLPQIGTLKTASAEIRALNKELCIGGTSKPAIQPQQTTQLEIIQNRRRKKCNVRKVSVM